MDYITITGLKVFAHHGVLEEEKKNGQDFYLNAKLFVDCHKAGVSDELRDALNYAEVCQYMTEEFKRDSYDLIEKACDKLPKALEGIKPVLIYPLAGLLVIALIMCAVNPFMGMINTGLSNLLASMGDSSKVVLGCVLGAMMSIDMGGPFNKAAYVFGTAAIASGNYDIMAAVMIGGMVPPIAIALSTTFFKDRWTEEEQKNGPVNYIMGFSFITEGAIPYAAADPLRVIPACMIGAAVAGGLSMAFDCTLMAPHGGIFVFAVVGLSLIHI